MKLLPFLFFLAVAAVFVLTTPDTSGQGESHTAATPGWGSVWTEPANEQQRQLQNTVRQVNAALKAGNPQGALALCNQQLQKTPDSANFYVLRAGVYAQLKRYNPALADIDHARSITRQNQQNYETARLCVLAAALHESKQDYPAAVGDLQASLKLDRDNAQALNALAWLRATSPDPALRNGRESVNLARRAVALQSPATTYATLDTLAAAYAEANDFRRAVECEKRALNDAEKKIKNAAKARVFQKEASDRLAFFEQQHPYRAPLP